MKAIVCTNPGHFEMQDRPDPIRNENQALLKVNKVGICGTDLHAYAGNQPYFTYPRILGHELATEILDVGHNSVGLKEGDKAVVIPYIHCGNCVACLNGKTNCCTQLKVLGVHTDGGMQNTIVVQQDLIIACPELTEAQMAIVEPLSIGYHALQRAPIVPGETVLVIGCGPIGLGLLKLAQGKGAKTMALDLNPKRLQFAQEVLGVEHVIDGRQDPLKQLQDLTDNRMVNTVFDATGNKGALEQGHRYMSHGGSYILVGLSKGELTFNHPEIHAKETSILCSRNATKKDFQEVISLLEQDHFPTDAYITHTVDYTEMISQFTQWTNPQSNTIKAVVNF